jgi:DNA polymerase-3 subunit gamma/tau
MYTALYRKWRPKKFEDVYGQEQVTATLKNELENNKISHAYLLCGTRGTGKTSTARLLAKAVNCGSPI